MRGRSPSLETTPVETPRVVVVDHHDSYTWNLVHLIASVTGELPVVVEHDQVSAADLGGFTHVVLSPGPGHPDVPADFAVGRDLLLAARTPVLGVCLGMQGLVSAYGGRVAQVPPAHGVVESVEHDGTGLFDGLPSPFEAVRYHSLAAVTVPDVLRVTAWAGSGDERVVMAVEHRDLRLAGVQFHPESVLSRHGAPLIANFLGVGFPGYAGESPPPTVNSPWEEHKPLHTLGNRPGAPT